MAHDNDRGKIELGEGDRPRISWPNAGSQPIFKQINYTLRKASRALGGDFVPNPLWSKSLGRNLVTVHPLGGCPMGDDAGSAVVNHKGCVFSSTHGDAAYEDLRVVDGAIMPMSLGVNPLLTISALAERSCDLIAKDRRLTIDYGFKRQAQKQADPVGLSFTERMSGFFSTDSAADFSALEARGRKAKDETIEFTVTVAPEDLNAMLNDEAHEAAMVGTLACSALTDCPMTISNGRFSLFVKESTGSRVRLMVYRASLCGPKGEAFDLHGVKRIKPGPPTKAWHDTTTLYATISQRHPSGAVVVGKGILHVALGDFLRQLRTFEVTNAPSLAGRVGALASFVKYFSSVLLAAYGGVFARR